MQGTARTASDAPVSLLDVLSQRQAQARRHGATYLAPVADQDSMLFWLARACKAAREAAGRKQVHVAASANSDQSTIARFEKATAWPRATDQIVAAYADDLDIDPLDLWQEAMRLWADDRAGGLSEPPELAPLRR